MSRALSVFSRLLLAAAFASVVVAGCGQKGPLYLPDEPESPEDKQERPTASPGRTTPPGY